MARGQLRFSLLTLPCLPVLGSGKWEGGPEESEIPARAGVGDRGPGAHGGAAQSLKERDVAQAGPARAAAWLVLRKARLRVEDIRRFGRWWFLLSRGTRPRERSSSSSRETRLPVLGSGGLRAKGEADMTDYLQPRARPRGCSGDRDRRVLLPGSLVSCSGTIGGSLLLIRAIARGFPEPPAQAATFLPSLFSCSSPSRQNYSPLLKPPQTSLPPLLWACSARSPPAARRVCSGPSFTKRPPTPPAPASFPAPWPVCSPVWPDLPARLTSPSRLWPLRAVTVPSSPFTFAPLPWLSTPLKALSRVCEMHLEGAGLQRTRTSGARRRWQGPGRVLGRGSTGEVLG